MDELNRVGALIGSDDATAMLALADEILERGVSVERFVIALVDYLRSLLLLRHGVTRPGILGYPEASFSAEARARLPVSQLELAGELLLEVHRNLKQSVSPRFELELLLSRLARVTGMVTPDELLAEVHAIKDQFAGDAGGAPAKMPAAAPGGPGPGDSSATPPAGRRQAPATEAAGSGHGTAPPGAGATQPPSRYGPRSADPDDPPRGGGRPIAAAPVLRAAGPGAAATPATMTADAPAAPAGRDPADGVPVARSASDAAPDVLHDISARVRAQNQLSLAAALERAVATEVDGGRVTVTFAAGDRYAGGQVVNAQQTVASAASEILGRPVSVGVDYRREQGAAAASARAAAPEDPDVGRFCKMFRGEVVKEIAHGT